MARQLRVEYAGAIYHVTVRSNGGERLFRNDGDRRYLLGRLSEAVAMHGVRVYLFCLMPNHVHLVVETPRGNLSAFMHGVLTGYGVYFNRAHGRHGHVTQGRFGAKLVRGDEYLLKLSRYVHLNPVKVRPMAATSPAERVQALRQNGWSSYRAYIGLESRNAFVDYEPMLRLVGGEKKGRETRYRDYIEGGIAQEDEEFLSAMVRSPRSIGDEDFREWVEDKYRHLVASGGVREDAAFRQVTGRLCAKEILDSVARSARMEPEGLTRRRRNCPWRAVTAQMLCRYGALTQREAALVLGLRTGVGVSCQLRSLTRLMECDPELRKGVEAIGRRLDARAKAGRWQA